MSAKDSIQQKTANDFVTLNLKIKKLFFNTSVIHEPYIKILVLSKYVEVIIFGHNKYYLGFAKILKCQKTSYLSTCYMMHMLWDIFQMKDK